MTVVIFELGGRVIVIVFLDVKPRGRYDSTELRLNSIGVVLSSSCEGKKRGEKNDLDNQQNPVPSKYSSSVFHWLPSLNIRCVRDSHSVPGRRGKDLLKLPPFSRV